MVRSPGRYKWSSYHATVGLEKISSFLTTEWILSQFGRSRKVAQEKYKTFVEEGIGKPGPWGKLRVQILLGDDTFVESLEPYIKKVREVEEVLSQFGRSRKVAREKYKTFVEEGIGKPGPWGKLRGQILLGDDTFVESLEPYIKKVREVEEVPRGQRFVDRPGLEELLRDVEYQPNAVRDNLIREAHWKHWYTLVEIAEIVGLHYTTVSRIVNQR